MRIHARSSEVKARERERERERKKMCSVFELNHSFEQNAVAFK